MSVRATLETNSAFVLRPDHIRRVWALFESKVGPVSALALCADDFEREFNTIQELLDYDNFPARKIVALQIGTWDKDSDPTASISFMQQRYSPSIRFTATGVEEQVAVLKQHIANLLDAITPWYSFLSGTPRTVFLLSAASLPMFFLTLAINVPLHKTHTPPSLSTLFLAIMLMAVAFIALGFVAAGLNALRVRLFPIGLFALGAEQSRYQTDENIRWVVIVGFFVSLAASVVFALIWR